MPQFKQPVSMETPHEMSFNSLGEKLQDLGYTPMCIVNYHAAPYMVTNANNHHDGYTNAGSNMRHERGRYFIPEYNPELFLALAAMTTGDDWIVGEYLVCINGHNKIFKYKRLEGANSDEGWADNNQKHTYRKATKEELIQHFKNPKMQQSKKVRIEEFAKILTVACDDWVPKLIAYQKENITRQNNILYVNITKTFYDAMISASNSSQVQVIKSVVDMDENWRPYTVREMEVLAGRYFKYKRVAGGYEGKFLCLGVDVDQEIMIGHDTYTNEQFFESFVHYSDDSPCGVKEEN